MSNVYIQEPPTSGKILLLTTVGDIEIELWTKETPKTCSNFMKLCINGYYHNTIFNRVVKGFIVQGGNPMDTNEEEENICSHDFKGEFHSRLRFCRRGLVAMANEKNKNDFQFFITLGATPELQNKHTIFGKVVGDTIYNILKLEDVEIDHNERPVYPQKILKIKILLNPFDDLKPELYIKKRIKRETLDEKKHIGVKNLKLLSFGNEAEEDEEEINIVNKQLNSKSKSAHDNLQDPKLSTVTDLELKDISNEKIEKLLDSNHESSSGEETMEKHEDIVLNNDVSEEVQNPKNYKRKKEKVIQIDEVSKQESQINYNEVLEDYRAIKKNYKKATKTFASTGTSRENFTLELLTKFKTKLRTAKEHQEEDCVEIQDTNKDNAWMTHSLKSENPELILARDASTKTDNWFEIYDPRNSMNKRRRGEKCNKRK